MNIAQELERTYERRQSTLLLIELEFEKEAEANARAAKFAGEVNTDDENEES